MILARRERHADQLAAQWQAGPLDAGQQDAAQQGNSDAAQRRARDASGQREPEPPVPQPQERAPTKAEHVGARPQASPAGSMLAQLDELIVLLAERDRQPSERTVHETRKAIKRLRALLRLLRPALGERRFERENRALRDAGRRLAGARDAQVMLDTLEAIVRRHPKQLARSAAVERLRVLLVGERDAIARLAGDRPSPLELTRKDLLALRARVERWKLDDRDRSVMRTGLKRVYATGRRRHARARRTGDTTTMHAWRKRVKDLRYAAELLDLGHGAEALGRGDRRKRALARLARHADRLGELLGEEHDLALLAERVRQARDSFDGERATHADLLRLIARRRKRLRRRALDRGRRLYRATPSKLAKRTLNLGGGASK